MDERWQILSDAVAALIRTAERIEGAVDWSRLPASDRDDFDMALTEAREALGLDDGCEGNSCAVVNR